MDQDRWQYESGTSRETIRPFASASSNHFDVPITVFFRRRERIDEESDQSFQTKVSLKSADALEHLCLTPGKTQNRVTLLKRFANSVAAGFRAAIEKRDGAKIVRVTGKIDSIVFRQVVETLEREGLIVQAEPPKYVKQRIKYWRLA